MKYIFRPALLCTVAASLMLTSCIDETEPTNLVTQEQLGSSDKGLEAMLKAMPAYMKKYHVWSDHASDFAYPSIMIARNFMAGDCFQPYNGFQHFYSYQSVSKNLDDQYLMSQINWYFYNFEVRTCESMISAIDANTENPAFQSQLAQALTYRASILLDMARTYEYLPSDNISPVNKDGNNVTGLTVPVTIDGVTDPDNNPRMKHDDMRNYLIGQLDEAIGLFKKSGIAPASKDQPSEAVAHGIKARVYMWDEDYVNAAKEADLAITTSGATPLTRAQFLDTKSGFNDWSPSAWLWGLQIEGNDDVVYFTGWGSFMIAESDYGYAGQHGCAPSVDKNFYESISDNDWRKLLFKAPKGSALSGQEPFLNAAKGAKIAPYVSIKFRCGQGVTNDPTVTNAVAIPLMRVEEMYLIKAEALAHTNYAQGKAALENFMKNYRYAEYVNPANDQASLIEEIFKQKSIELWGEGQTFFDVKRLNVSVTRAYSGTNWPAGCRFNTVGRPGWTTWPFVAYEGNFNKGVEGWLNPNIGDKFTSLDNI